MSSAQEKSEVFEQAQDDAEGKMASLTCAATLIIALFFGLLLSSNPYRQPQFWIESAVLSSYNLSCATVELTATWNFTLVAINPNKHVDIIFSDIIFSEDFILLRRRYALGNMWPMPMTLRKRSQTKVNVTVDVESQKLRGDRVAEKMWEEMKRGWVDFHASVESLYAFSDTPHEQKGYTLDDFTIGFRVLNNVTPINHKYGGKVKRYKRDWRWIFMGFG